MTAEQKWQEARDILNSNPTEQELQKAIALIQEAVADNHAGAYFTLAVLYFTGNGFEQDKQKAFDYLQQSHALGYERSKLMLATFLIEGEFVEKDLSKAELYLRELAEKGDVDACAHLSQNIFDDVFPNDDKEEGVIWLRKAAELGHPTAMARLGQICGNRCQDEEAHFWFCKARSEGVEGIDEAEQQYSTETYSQRRIDYIRYCLSVKDYSAVTDIIERDANHGDTEALYLIADFYINGMGEDQFGMDVERGLKIYEELSSKGNAHAYYMLGRLYGRGPVEQDFEKAVMYYKKSAEAGHPDAQYAVGCIYNDGLIGEVNKEEATKWIELAAGQNQRDALCLLAFSYIQDPSIGTLRASNLSYEQNIEKGMDFLTRAAGLGQPSALYVFAQCYHEGKYLDKDDEKAYYCLQKSIMSEAMPDSMNLMGDFFRDGIGTEKNYEIAAKHYQWAADNGNTSAMLSLSNLYEEGLGVEKNEELAVEFKNRWWEAIQWNIYGIMPLDYAKEQAKEGNEEAMYQLGQRYQNGNGVDQNIEIASDWWHKAATKGHVPACHDLGIYYVFTKHDLEKGLKWLSKSASADYVLSYRALGDIYLNGWGVESDVEKGIAYLTKAAEKDHEDTQLRLASVYHNGEHVDKDFSKAKYWFEKYLSHGSAEANYRMGRCLFEGDMYEQNYPQALEYFAKAVKEGCHDASPYYINMLWFGNNVEKNQEIVLTTYKELAENNDEVATYYLYTLYNDDQFSGKNQETAVAYLQKSADMGYDEALKELGLQYCEDGIFETDLKKANEYFALAAEKGNTVAMVNLAISYQIGREVEKNLSKALELYNRAAEAGDRYAAREAGRIYLVGEDNVIDVNYDKAIQLLHTSAEEDTESCFLLAFAMNAKCDTRNGYSWELAEKAFNYMYKAAQVEHPEAMYRVAYSLMEGRGVIIDMDSAKQWFEKTLSKDHRADEIKEILNNYFSGDDSAEKYPRYVYWHSIADNNPALVMDKEPLLDEEGGMIPLAVLKGAAKCGEVNASSLLGIILLNEEPEKAKKYIMSVIKRGYHDIADHVGKLFYNGNGVDLNFEKAIEYFNLGLEAGNISCALSLGLMYTADGVSTESEEYGKGLLQAVCDATDQSSDEYNYAKAQLDRIEKRNNSGWNKFSKGIKSLFGK